MMRRTIAAGLCVGLAACGTNPKPQVSATPPAPAVQVAPQPPPEPPKPVVDPVAAIARRSAFRRRWAELKAGHLDAASAGRGRRSPPESRMAPALARMREHFDRLIDRIIVHEVTALARGMASPRKIRSGADRRDPKTRPPSAPARRRTMAAVKADFALNATTFGSPSTQRSCPRRGDAGRMRVHQDSPRAARACR